MKGVVSNHSLKTRCEQLLLSWLYRPIENSRTVLSCQPPVNRIVLREERQNFDNAGSIAPISHEIADNAEQADKLDSCIGHAIVRHIADEFSGRAGRFDVGPDTVPGLSQGESTEGGTWNVWSDHFRAYVWRNQL